ncbi:fimbrial protein [Huaxiibacter chinensis]
MIFRAAMVVAFPLLLTTARADVNIDVTGFLLPPFCTVHDGSHGTIVVDFGDDININRIDGSRYRKTIAYQIDCESDGQLWQMKLKLVGPSAWDNQTLRSDKSSLGLRFQLGGQPVELGRDIPISSATVKPMLTVVPVLESQGSPTEGAFRATASLQAEYY